MYSLHQHFEVFQHNGGCKICRRLMRGAWTFVSFVETNAKSGRQGVLRQEPHRKKIFSRFSRKGKPVRNCSLRRNSRDWVKLLQVMTVRAFNKLVELSCWIEGMEWEWNVLETRRVGRCKWNGLEKQGVVRWSNKVLTTQRETTRNVFCRNSDSIFATKNLSISFQVFQQGAFERCKIYITAYIRALMHKECELCKHVYVVLKWNFRNALKKKLEI